jgi:hypothetical protein
MLLEAKMKKVQQLEYMATMEVQTKNGKFFMLIKLIRLELRV